MLEALFLEASNLIAPYKAHLVTFVAGGAVGIYLYNKMMKILIGVIGVGAMALIVYLAAMS